LSGQDEVRRYEEESPTVAEIIQYLQDFIRFIYYCKAL